MSYHVAPIQEKIQKLDQYIEQAWSGSLKAPLQPSRDILVCMPEFHPDKKGLSFSEGQARLLHDLASIELQAMELGLRTLQDFPEANEEFRERLVRIVKEESIHLQLCLTAIEELGFSWGDWPVHTLLWNAVSAEDSLLDRILIVHRYLEGSGLDAGDNFSRRLSGVQRGCAHEVVSRIFKDEMGHVQFGSHWYNQICKDQGVDPNQDFVSRMNSLRERLPKRIEKISRQLRLQAGFSELEVNYLEDLRLSMVKTF